MINFQNLFTAFNITLIIRKSDKNSYPMIANVSAEFVDTRAEILELENGDKVLEFSNNTVEILNVVVTEKETSFGVDRDPSPLKFIFKVIWVLDIAKIVSCNNGDILNCPIIDRGNKNDQELELIVELQDGCEDNDACKCELSASVLSYDQEFVVGKDQHMALSFVVKNNGSEPGYGANIFLLSDVNLPIPIESGKEICQNVLKLNS